MISNSNTFFQNSIHIERQDLLQQILSYNQSLQTQINQSKLRQQTDEVLKQDLQNQYQYYKQLQKPPSPLQDLSIHSKLLSNSFFAITKKHDLCIEILIKTSVVPANIPCPCGHQKTLNTHLKTALYQCLCGNTSPILQGPLWEEITVPINKIILIFFFWINNIREGQIVQYSAVELDQVKKLMTRLRQIVSTQYVETLPLFKGIVEIDESSFRNAKNNTLVLMPKWVFGLYQRETKRTFLQVVYKRNAKTLLPIIQERCELGTTIISDQWKAYEQLDQLGFPHYSVDHSRYFVNPNNRDIHTQNIEVTWCWAKYNIKRNCRSMQDLQRRLHEFSWKRMFKRQHKLEEMATTLRSLFGTINNYQYVLEKSVS